MHTDHEKKLAQELKIFDQYLNVHDLPDIFHYWSNKYLKPMFEEYDISHPDDLFINNMIKSAHVCDKTNSDFISIGSGNCDTEIRLAKGLIAKGFNSFHIECLDINANMLNRGRELAKQEGVIDYLSFVEMDFNNWNADKEYVSIIACQSLHHVQNLEGLFNEINRSLHEDGSFIIHDMIGRNGHQRWPEALQAVHNFWQELPEEYKYNHLLKRFEPMYENWDCSTEGFEGIRAQDILPLLVQSFHFELFIGFANTIDIFIERCFGHNFKVDKQWDTDFIDRVHKFDEESISNGSLKPTNMMAVLKKSPVESPNYSRGFSPEFCVRDPNGT